LIPDFRSEYSFVSKAAINTRIPKKNFTAEEEIGISPIKMNKGATGIMKKVPLLKIRTKNSFPKNFQMKRHNEIVVTMVVATAIPTTPKARDKPQSRMTFIKTDR